MKQKLTIASFLLGIMLFQSCSTQDSKTKNKVEKEIRVEEENGVKTVTIVTTTNGVKKEEIYTGEEAEMKLKELKSESKSIKSEGGVKVEMTEINGKKKLTVTSTKEGKEVVEVFEGKEAERKLKELESSKSKKGKKIIIKEERVIEKSNE